MKYHGISAYQFYMALKHVDEGTAPDFTHGNSNQEHSSIKTDMCMPGWDEFARNWRKVSQQALDWKPKGYFLKSYFEI
jgi:hypothetical protein